MFIFLLGLISIAGAAANPLTARSVCANPPRGDDKIRKAFFEGHNKIRQELATGLMDDDGGALTGSTSLFMLSYNCELEIQALVASSACESESNTPGDVEGKSVNYGIARGNIAAPSDDQAVDDIKEILEKWKETRYNVNFDKTTVIYESEDAAPFARIVYNKSISLGCAVFQCGPKRTAYACAYSASPVFGKPLYWPSTKGAGCTKDTECRKAIPGKSTTCDTNLNLCFANLLTLDDDTSTTATTESETTVESTSAETSTAAQTSQSTAATETSQSTAAAQTSPSTAAAQTSQSTAAAQTSPSTAAAQTSQSTATAAVTTPAGASGVMTEELRQMVVDTHNTDRSLVAQGAVRNGKPGNANLGPAIDMLRMRYDTALETEAQAYANTCALTKSDVSTRPDSGENTHVIQSSTVTVSDALTKSMQTWWNQILSNGVNAKLRYTATLDAKSNAPLGFTQMAWAATYKVGCGVSRCSSSTFVVCRYNPRGNIIGQYIYNVGANCRTCMTSCTEALCATPA
ncbi:hypothetical protein RB195_007695 [Necator americanus]|uniref:SCP domain-containing protein n=1 Tax=Necator americanus TaxID=51031 RepID=A0ABR1C138_NECAM